MLRIDLDVGGWLVTLRGTVVGSREDPAGLVVALGASERDKINYLNGFVRGGLLNLREKPRLPIRLSVTYGAVEGPATTFTKDINAEGVFLFTEKPLPETSQVHMLVAVPGKDQPLSLVGKVSHTIIAENEEPPGMGIVFELDDAQREALQGVMKELEEALEKGKLPTPAAGVTRNASLYLGTADVGSQRYSLPTSVVSGTVRRGTSSASAPGLRHVARRRSPDGHTDLVRCTAPARRLLRVVRRSHRLARPRPADRHAARSRSRCSARERRRSSRRAGAPTVHPRHAAARADAERARARRRGAPRRHGRTHGALRGARAHDRQRRARRGPRVGCGRRRRAVRRAAPRVRADPRRRRRR